MQETHQSRADSPGEGTSPTPLGRTWGEVLRLSADGSHDNQHELYKSFYPLFTLVTHTGFEPMLTA